jgi:hypothetical protein
MPNRVRLVLACALMMGLLILLTQLGSAWAQPPQSSLHETIPSRTPTPTGGPTSTATTQPGPGVVRLLLQQGIEGYAGTSDTWLLNSGSPDALPQPRGGGLSIKGGELKSVLVRFELQGKLPPNAEILAAELVFYVENAGPQSLQVGTFRVLRPWAESAATWYYATSSIRWATPGCNAVGSDRVGTADDTLTLMHRAVYRGLNVTDSVRYWLQHPDQNYGWLVKGVGDSNPEYGFASSRNIVPERRPALRIDYTIPATPTSTFTPSPSGTAITTTPTPTGSTMPTQTPTPQNTWTSTPTAQHTATPTSPGTPTMTWTPTRTPQPTVYQVTGTVYYDANHNGVRDPGEQGIAGATVELLTLSRQVLATRVTGEDGACVFANLNAGWYRLRQVNLPGYLPTTDHELTILLGYDLDVTFGNYPNYIVLPYIIK